MATIRLLASARALRRFATVTRCPPGVAAWRTTSRGIRRAPECCLQRCNRSSGSLLPPRRSPFPVRPRGLPSVAVPRSSHHGFILSCASVPSRVSRATTGPAKPGASLGLPCPHRDVNRQSPRTRASQSRFVPPSTFRTSPTACSSAGLAGLFRPAAASRVRSPGVSPREKPYGLVARRCPPVVRALPLPPVSRRRQGDVLAFRALLSSRIRCGR